MRAIAICVAVAACHHARVAPPANAAHEGLAIALYTDGSAVIDDRRWIDVTGDRLLIDRVDAAAALPSLVIEPLAGGPLTIGACTRDRIGDKKFAPAIQCAVHGAPGRHLVRVLYVSTKNAYQSEHDIAVHDGTATVTSRFALQTPSWNTRAELTLYDGLPGGKQPPREIARGTLLLDGSVAVLAVPPRDVAAHLRWIYDGAMHTDNDVPPQDQMWGRESHTYVWVWLELDDTRLAAGPIRAHVGDREIAVPAQGRKQTQSGLHLPLWVDDQLRGKRDRWIESAYGAALTDRFEMSVANLGDTPREVWIEERLRPARRHTVGRAWPGKPIIGKEAVRTKVTVVGGTIERVGFAVDYEF